MQVVHIKEQSMNHLLYDMSKYYVEVSKFWIALHSFTRLEKNVMKMDQM